MSTQAHKFKQFRQDMLDISALIKEMDGSRESSLAFTNAQTSMMFFGNCIKQINGFTPYVNSMSPENQIIEPFHLDKGLDKIDIVPEWEEYNQIQAIKYVRQLLETFINQTSKLYSEYAFNGILASDPLLNLYFAQAILSATEVKNWMGMLLGAIRDKAESKELPVMIASTDGQ